MFFPKINHFSLNILNQRVKGPVSILYSGETSWITAYEHASQDNLNGVVNKTGAEDHLVDISGKVGDSPEVYTQINTEESAGQIIVFDQSGEISFCY